MTKFLARAAALSALAVPTLAVAGPSDPLLTPVPPDQRLSLVPIFAHAHPLVQVVLALLVLASLASLVLWIGQIARRGPRSAASVAGLSGIAAAAPLLGLLGGAYDLMDTFIGVANVRPVPSLSILAPGFAEAMLCVTLGLLAATIATIGRHHLNGTLQARALRPAGDLPAPSPDPRAPLARAAWPG